MLAILFYGSGVPVIPIVSNAIFSKTSVPPVVAVQVMSLTCLVGACVGPFVVTFMRSKTIFMVGYIGCSLLLLVITILFCVNQDQVAFYIIIVLTFLQTITMGSFSWPYIGSISYSAQLAAANTVSWFSLIVMQTLLQVDAKNVAANFGFFFLMNSGGTFYVWNRVKYTEGCSFDQLKKLYYP